MLECGENVDKNKGEDVTLPIHLSTFVHSKPSKQGKTPQKRIKVPAQELSRGP